MPKGVTLEDKDCFRCGRRYESHSNHSKYCPDCRSIAHHEQTERWHSRHRDDPSYRANSLARTKKWQAEHPEDYRAGIERCYLHRAYGLAPEDYRRMLVLQVGVCAICGSSSTTGRRLEVDHDHKTGQVRGLLCTNCNRGLGGFHDSSALLGAATIYLAERSPET